MGHAKVIVDFIIDQKFGLIPPEVEEVVSACALMFLTIILQNSWISKFRLVMNPSSGSCHLHL